MIRIYLKNGTPVDLPTGVDVEPTVWPACPDHDGRAALEVVDRDKDAVALFQLGEVAGVVYGPREGPGRR